MALRSFARSGILQALVCAVVLGTFSAFADWLWKHFIPDGAVLPGVVHGAVIFLLLAAALAWAARTRTAWRRLASTLPVTGLLIAASFYPVALAVGYLGGLLWAWFAMWLSLAVLQRWARDGEETVLRALLRGVLAAAGSGLAFWSVSGLWTDPSMVDTAFWIRLLLWSFAFFPGFVALLVGHPLVHPASAEAIVERRR